MATDAAARVVDLEETEGSIGELAERVARASQLIDAYADENVVRCRDEAVLHEVSALFRDLPLDDLEREIDMAVDAVRARRHVANSNRPR